MALAFLGNAQAQTTATLDGTSGNNTISTSYSTNGNLTLGMGFYVDYLIVGGGGGGGKHSWRWWWRGRCGHRIHRASRHELHSHNRIWWKRCLA
jgi:hypothetical protein